MASIAIPIAAWMVAPSPEPSDAAYRAFITSPLPARSRGDLILLENQDRSLWDRGRIAEAQGLIERALGSRRVGPYLLQAVIAAIHAEAPSAGETDWAQIVALYDVLRRVDPCRWWP